MKEVITSIKKVDQLELNALWRHKPLNLNQFDS